MKSVEVQRTRFFGVIGALLCLLTLLFPLVLRAESKTVSLLAFGLWTDQFYIGVARNDGTPLHRYTQNGFSLDPSLSPDGHSLFFCDTGTIDAGVGLQIYRLDLDTEILYPVSDRSAVDEWPVCSPDGKQLAFISRIPKPAKDEDPNYRIYVSDITGKNRRPADPEGDTPQLYPSWSPDGKKLIYNHSKMTAGSRLLIRDLQKKTTTNLLPFYIFASQPAWSPKGDQIAYTDISLLTKKKTIWVVNVDGSGRRQITEGPDDQQPHWYPDGSKLLFSHKDGEREEGKPRRSICSVDVKTREVKKIISMENGSADCPSIVTVLASKAPRRISQSQEPQEPTKKSKKQ